MTNNFENKNYMQSINEEMQHAPIGLGFSSFGRGCDFFFWVWVKG